MHSHVCYDACIANNVTDVVTQRHTKQKLELTRTRHVLSGWLWAGIDTELRLKALLLRCKPIVIIAAYS